MYILPHAHKKKREQIIMAGPRNSIQCKVLFSP